MRSVKISSEHVTGKRHLEQGTEFDLADINGDGRIDTKDIFTVVRNFP